MCRWLAYKGPEIYLDSVVFDRENSLINQSLRARRTHVTTNGDGFGVGWYGQRPDPGVYRDILPAWNDPNLKNLTHQVQSGLFFAHVRASTGTATSRANCHPFAHGRWLFMHNGQIGCYLTLKRQLEAAIDDGYYPHRLGTTDSEALFYLMLTLGLDKDPAEAIRRAIDVTVGLMAKCHAAEPFRMTAALADGKRLYAIRYSTDPIPPSLYWQCRAGQLLVVSEPLDEESWEWNEVPPSHLLVADAGCEPVTRPLGL